MTTSFTNQRRPMAKPTITTDDINNLFASLTDAITVAKETMSQLKASHRDLRRKRKRLKRMKAYVKRAVPMSNEAMKRLLANKDSDNFTDKQVRLFMEKHGYTCEELYEATQVDGLGYYMLNHSTVDSVTMHALDQWMCKNCSNYRQ